MRGQLAHDRRDVIDMDDARTPGPVDAPDERARHDRAEQPFWTDRRRNAEVGGKATDQPVADEAGGMALLHVQGERCGT